MKKTTNVEESIKAGYESALNLDYLFENKTRAVCAYIGLQAIHHATINRLIKARELIKEKKYNEALKELGGG